MDTPVLPEYRYQEHADDRGENFMIVHPDGRRIAMHVPTALSQNERIGKPIASAASIGMNQFKHFVQSNQDGIHGAALQREADHVVTAIKTVMKWTVDEVRNERANLQRRKAESLNFNRDAAPNAHVRAEIRNWFRTQSNAVQVKMLLDADYNLAVSVLEIGPKFLGIAPDVWQKFETRAMAALHVKKSALDASNSLQSTPEMITAAGVDMDAAMQQAEKAVERLNSEMAALDDAERFLQSMVQMQCLISGKTPSEILA